MRQIFWIAISLAILIFLVFLFFSKILIYFPMDKNILTISVSYLKAVSYGMFFYVLFRCLSSFSEGMTLTLPVFIVVFIGSLINIPLDIIFAFGFGADSRSYEKPGVNGKVGKIISVSLSDMKINWTHEQEAMFLTSSLTTAGGITFIGDLDRYLNAFDSKSGDLIWKTRLSSALHGFPITYSINNKQYVAVTTGMGVFRALTSLISLIIYLALISTMKTQQMKKLLKKKIDEE